MLKSRQKRECGWKAYSAVSERVAAVRLDAPNRQSVMPWEA